MAPKKLRAADLFCGAGGTSTGLFQACESTGQPVELVAVNHWSRAVETHAANHPRAAHFCQNLADLDPKKAVPGGKLDLLVASPECTHHSVARGGKPVNDQSRASAYCLHRWCAALDVKRVLIENVPEFATWGPLGTNGRPLKTGRGKLFAAFVDTFRAMGYRVDWRVFNAADYGGATTRRRLFIQAAKGRLPIHWPAATHEPDPQPNLLGNLPRWRSAREAVIDWKIRGTSIFGRKRRLSENTLKRIEAGLIKFGGKNAEPFLVILRRHMAGQSIDGPIPTLTAGGEHIGVCEPFIVPQNGSNGPRSAESPVPTITTTSRGVGLVEPFLMGMSQSGSNGDRLRNLDRPINTITTADDTAVVEPFVMHTTHHGGDRVYSPDDPLPCVTGANRGEQALVEPFILPPEGIHRGNAPRSVSDPLQTVTAGRGGGCIVEPFILPHRKFDRMDVDSVDRPIRTIDATNGGNNVIVEPFFTPFYANGEADSTADPLRTVTTRDRFGLVSVDGVYLDILFRMLQPHELAAAMGFPDGYKITGNRSEQVRQVGNAVEVNQARELLLAMLTAEGIAA